MNEEYNDIKVNRIKGNHNGIIIDINDKPHIMFEEGLWFYCDEDGGDEQHILPWNRDFQAFIKR